MFQLPSPLCLQSMDLDGGGRVDYNRVILMSDIQSIKKQEYDKIKSGLVYGVLALLTIHATYILLPGTVGGNNH